MLVVGSRLSTASASAPIVWVNISRISTKRRCASRVVYSGRANSSGRPDPRPAGKELIELSHQPREWRQGEQADRVSASIPDEHEPEVESVTKADARSCDDHVQTDVEGRRQQSWRRRQQPGPGDSAPTASSAYAATRAGSTDPGVIEQSPVPRNSALELAQLRRSDQRDPPGGDWSAKYGRGDDRRRRHRNDCPARHPDRERRRQQSDHDPECQARQDGSNRCGLKYGDLGSHAKDSSRLLSIHKARADECNRTKRHEPSDVELQRLRHR